MTTPPVTADNTVSTVDWNCEADLLWKQGDRQGAINKILAVITANPPHVTRSASLQFVYYLFQLQDYVTGEKVLSDLLRKYPADLEILEKLASGCDRRWPLARFCHTASADFGQCCY
jgi:hypothetical protein